jgi:SAM-dependent methyltransferase
VNKQFGILPSMINEEFDDLADNYKQSISPWIRITGETIEFFAQSRIKWVAKQLKRMGLQPRRIMDFGCGVGLAIPFLLEEFGSDSQIIGVDVSSDSLEIARSKYASENIRFHSLHDYTPDQSADLVYCNGVFHHIPLDERDNAVHYVRDSLRPGGFFALWENNPWNPIAKYNMTHAEIDRNAIPISPSDGKKLVTTNGLQLLQMRYHFIFPAFLKFLRPVEPLLSQIPLGAQYVVFSRKVSK